MMEARETHYSVSQNGEQVLNEGLKEKEIRREDDVEQSIWIDPMGQQS